MSLDPKTEIGAHASFKTIKKQYILMKIFLSKWAVALLFATIALTETPVGIELVYIPQSALSGGTNLNYAVPTGLGTAKNFKVEGDLVNVLLGVSKSGKADAEAFTVDVSTRSDTINQLIAGGATFQLLPSSAYTLPQTVTVASGASSANFNLAINKTALKTYAGKKMAVCVVVSNPSLYTLSAKNRQVIVIIDVNALKLD
jgi:hypothetical protein